MQYRFTAFRGEAEEGTGRQVLREFSRNGMENDEGISIRWLVEELRAMKRGSEIAGGSCGAEGPVGAFPPLHGVPSRGSGHSSKYPRVGPILSEMYQMPRFV